MKLKRKLNKSYYKVYRNRHLVARSLQLSDGEFRLWDLMTALYDWDKKHKETFGTLEATDRQLSSILNCSASTVWRHRKGLIKKGLIKEVGRSFYQVFPPQIDLEKIADTERLVLKMQDKNSSTEQKLTQMKQNQGHSSKNSLVSYKDNNSLLKDDREYKRIWEEMGEPEDFTIADMKFIDKTLEV